MAPFKLHHIVRLRDALHKWRRSAALKSRSLSRGSSSARAAASAPLRVPPGHLAVYVGQERERFVIKTSLLAHPLFKALLKKTEEEVGFHYEGGLTIPCEVAAFERLLLLMQGKHAVNNMKTMMMKVYHGHHHDPRDVLLDVQEHHVDEYPLQGFYGLLRELLGLHVMEISSHLPSRCLPDSRPSLMEGARQQPICG